MFEFRQALTVRRPPEDVFRLLTRFADIPRFVPQVVSAEQTSEGPVSVGTTFVQRVRLLGATIETPTVVTVFEPFHRFGYRAEEGPVPYEAVYGFQAIDGATRLEADVRVSLRGAARAIEPIAGRLVQRAYRRNLERMRSLLERDSPP